jgi:hypothetical protein
LGLTPKQTPKHPSPPSVPEANIQREVQNPPCQIETSDLASILAPKSGLQKKSKNNLFRSDTTDPEAQSGLSERHSGLTDILNFFLLGLLIK